MKYYALVNAGLETTAEKEIKEKLNVDATLNKFVLELESPKTPKLQSVRRLLQAITETKDINKVDFTNPNKNLFTDKRKFKILVENVKGQENRLDIARNLAKTIYKNIKTKPKLELKQPDFLIVVFYNQENYFIGIDKSVKELNTRDYRVFPNSASFKGDLAYYFVKQAQYQKGNKLLIGFCKDAAMAIEASLETKEKVYAFDEGIPNITAAKKNVKISQTNVEVQKYHLEDLDIKYDKNFFDNCIFQITNKDESKLNEIYHQVNYILKSKGFLMFIARPSWEVSISNKFDLVKEGEIKKGDNIYKIWLMRKKGELSE
jgi:hypothetical protein